LLGKRLKELVEARTKKRSNKVKKREREKGISKERRGDKREFTKILLRN